MQLASYYYKVSGLPPEFLNFSSSTFATNFFFLNIYLIDPATVHLHGEADFTNVVRAQAYTGAMRQLAEIPLDGDEHQSTLEVYFKDNKKSPTVARFEYLARLLNADTKSPRLSDYKTDKGTYA